MPEQRIKELELQLVTANASIVTLTATNAELTRDLADAESRNKKLKRSARQDESSFKEQLTIAQNRRG
jgi:phage shock protein A